MEQIIRVSTVTPVYAGADYLEALVKAISQVKDEWEAEGYPVRIIESIFVNDAAVDDSAQVLQRVQANYPWVHILTHSRNFGQHPATIAGILHTSGDWIITLDEDLQHDPKHFIKLLLTALKETRDIVYAKPEASVHQSKTRDLGSVYFKRLMVALTGNPHISYFNSFRLVRGAIARAAASVCSHETYLDIALSWFTSRIHQIKLPLKDERFIAHGKSGYNLHRLIGHARRMLTSSQTKSLRLGALVGVLSLGLTMLFGAFVLIRRMIDPVAVPVQGWTSLFLSQLLFGGLTLFMIGVMLEYVIGIHLHTQGKPVFFTIDRSSDASAKEYFTQKGIMP